MQGRIKDWANWAVAPGPALRGDDFFWSSLDFGRKLWTLLLGLSAPGPAISQSALGLMFLPDDVLSGSYR